MELTRHLKALLCLTILNVASSSSELKMERGTGKVRKNAALTTAVLCCALDNGSFAGGWHERVGTRKVTWYCRKGTYVLRF